MATRTAVHFGAVNDAIIAELQPADSSHVHEVVEVIQLRLG